MSVLFSNNASTTLSAGVGDSATSITVADGAVFPAISGSDYVYLTLEVDSDPDLKEIVKCTARSGNTLTIVRAQDGTSARTFSTADKCELRLTAAGLNDVATQADTDTTYTAGSGLSLTGTEFANTAPDQTVALTGAGATSVSGTYPNFTITSTDTTYSLPLSSSSTRGGVKIGYTENGKNYPVELSSEKMYVNVPWTDSNTTYSAGTGLSLTGTTFANTAPDQTVSLTGSGATSISGTYPSFTISSTDTNTTYSVGDGGLTQKNFTTTLKTKLDGIEANATADQTAAEIRALVESASDSNVFTDADHTKLDNAGTQSVVTTAPTSASGFANGHVWYVV